MTSAREPGGRAEAGTCARGGRQRDRQRSPQCHSPDGVVQAGGTYTESAGASTVLAVFSIAV